MTFRSVSYLTRTKLDTLRFISYVIAWPIFPFYNLVLHSSSYPLSISLKIPLTENIYSAAHHAMSGSIAGVVPASLSFLAIYNPSLSNSDDTFHEQIVYYYSKTNNARRSGKTNSNNDGEDTKEETHEKERQIGLAQGMVEFAK